MNSPMKTAAGSLATAALTALLASCGGGGGGPTAFTGTLVLPQSSTQCPGCSTNTVTVNLLGLNQDAGPTAIKQFTTDSRGRYDSGPLDQQLGGRKALIIVASVSQNAVLGGAESVSVHNDNSKDFDVATQVGCQAAVFLTAGNGQTQFGCEVVRTGGTCSTSTCFATISPAQLDSRRIGRLDAAGRLVQGSIDLSNGNQVKKAACAAINCTLAGTGEASAACMNGFLS